MIYITRKLEFCASHRLYNPKFSDQENEETFGLCNNPNGHGHNYVLEVTVEGDVDPETGMVLDLKKLKKLINEEIIDKDPAVIQGLMIQKLQVGLDKNELVLGIDPGSRTGLSVSYFGKEIERSIFNSVESLVMHIAKILAELRADRKIIKIGNGNMILAKEIMRLLNLRFCSDFELEFVDERKTSLKIKNYNQRGKRDMMSAKYISQREGIRHFILPLSRTG